MPEAKPPPEQRIDEIEERKPKSFSLQKAIKPRSTADSGPPGMAGGQRSPSVP